MGERSESILVTGAPGLDGLVNLATVSRTLLCKEHRLDANRPVALMIFHPVLQECEMAAGAISLILDILREQSIQVVAMMPNSDAGSDPIRRILLARNGQYGLRVLTHLERQHFVSWMATCDILIGNSSAGIIEAATFGTPVLNLGSRQNLRERNLNTLDASIDSKSILHALKFLLSIGRFPSANIYGDGRTAGRIADLLARLDLPILLSKTNAY